MARRRALSPVDRVVAPVTLSTPFEPHHEEDHRARKVEDQAGADGADLVRLIWSG